MHLKRDFGCGIRKAYALEGLSVSTQPRLTWSTFIMLPKSDGVV